jgi:hypothetical protein
MLVEPERAIPEDESTRQDLTKKRRKSSPAA